MKPFQRSGRDVTFIKKDRMNVPMVVRIQHLYTLGLSDTEISKTINDEMGDQLVSLTTPRMIRSTIIEYQEEFDRHRVKTKNEISAHFGEQLLTMFHRTRDMEIQLVDTLLKKIEEARSEMDSFNLSEVDKDGNHTNSRRFFILMNAIEGSYKTVSKIVGLDALREVELFTQKAAAKAQAENSSMKLIREVDNKGNVNWMDANGSVDV